MNFKLAPLLLTIIAVTSACNEKLKSPGDAFLIPHEQMTNIVKAANAGDKRAIRKLIDHYDAVSGGDAIANYWRAQAQRVGDSQELYYYAARLYTEATAEVDPTTRRKLLLQALEAAERSRRNNYGPSADKLIQDISSTLNSIPQE